MINTNMINPGTVRSKKQLYPDYTAEIEEINKNGISVSLLYKIIHKHRGNSLYNKKLYERYQALLECVPIYSRKPRYNDNENVINNKIANDFFSEIVDFKTGYFAGKAIAYSYSQTDESEEQTGSKFEVEKASKVISDFVTRNNMFDVDMETTKFASIYGYAGRLFFIDLEGNERVMPVHGYETIILSNTNITEPIYAIRYYCSKDIDGNKIWKVEFYDNANIYYYQGNLADLKETGEVKPHMFNYCPLQGIPNNKELMGDAEKVLSLIDDYDKDVSDNSNEVEAFVHAILCFENIRIDDKEITKAQHSGALRYNNGTHNGKAYYLTKQINDAFTEHHLERLKNNIYRFSKTPNLSDETFSAASGVSLRFKLQGLETKCGMFEAKMVAAGTYMFKLLASSWNKRGYNVDYLQCIMDFSRNFPLDLENEAQTAVMLKSVGLPMREILGKLSIIDDVDYTMRLIEEEKNDIPHLEIDNKKKVNESELKIAE